MGINSRVFGSDIDPKIKEKLEKRQEVANAPDPNTSVEDYHSSFNTLADLSSRTPFARMWTAVQLQELGKLENDKTEGGTKDIDKHIHYIISGEHKSRKKFPNKEQKIYTIGNHILNTLQLPPNTSTEERYFNDQQQTNKNEFMMPPEGITSVTSATEGMLGTIKKTTVNFIVNNFHDYENIYSKFFLRPGAQLFVDFGWDIADLYDPSELVKESDTVINEKLYGDGGYVTRSKGDLETVVGFVTTFDSKIRENGSVECSVEITSRNAALFSREVDDKLKNLITHSLDIEILRYAAAGYAGSGDVLKKSNKWYLSAEFKNDWKKVFQDLRARHLESKLIIFQLKLQLSSGYFINSPKIANHYIFLGDSLKIKY